jgi:hypothetical protein
MDDQRAKPAGGRRVNALRFSLRTLLILITVTAIWLGLGGASALRQKAATDSILKGGGSVFYDFQSKDWKLQIDAPPSGPTWLRAILGRDWFDTVTYVTLETPGRVTANDEETAKIIYSLPQLTILHLRFPPAGERTLDALNDAPQLKILFLNGDGITDEHI